VASVARRLGRFTGDFGTDCYVVCGLTDAKKMLDSLGSNGCDWQSTTGTLDFAFFSTGERLSVERVAFPGKLLRSAGALKDDPGSWRLNYLVIQVGSRKRSRTGGSSSFHWCCLFVTACPSKHNLATALRLWWSCVRPFGIARTALLVGELIAVAERHVVMDTAQQIYFELSHGSRSGEETVVRRRSTLEVPVDVIRSELRR